MPLAPRQPHSRCPSIFTEALNPEVNLAVWERQLPTHIELFAQCALATGHPLAESRVIDIEEDQPLQLTDLAKGFADIEGYTGFVADVAWLVQAYGCLTGATRVGLRLRTLSRAMCPRYHVDWVSLRLITTYAGVASQWLEEDAMPRARLGDPAAEPEQAPRQLKAGDVALFKGERWEGNEGRGIIHRSPPVATGEARLIMTLDWLK
jgi:hypothetical protein